jgi:hypothetical protein
MRDKSLKKATTEVERINFCDMQYTLPINHQI